MHGGLTVAYVPSPSFSSCWKADGLFLLLILAASNASACLFGRESVGFAGCRG